MSDSTLGAENPSRERAKSSSRSSPSKKTRSRSQSVQVQVSQSVTIKVYKDNRSMTRQYVWVVHSLNVNAPSGPSHLPLGLPPFCGRDLDESGGVLLAQRP